MVESYSLIPWENKISGRPVHFQLLLSEKCFISLTSCSIHNLTLPSTSRVAPERDRRREVPIFSCLAGGVPEHNTFDLLHSSAFSEMSFSLSAIILCLVSCKNVTVEVSPVFWSFFRNFLFWVPNAYCLVFDEIYKVIILLS